MAINLELRHLWTATGGPLTWTFDEHDESDLRHLLDGLGPYSAEPQKRSAVLVAREDDGTLIGAWNRDGVRQLASWIEAIERSEGWRDLRNALRDAESGP